MNSGTNIHSLAYFTALVMLAVSIPLSKYAMSVSQFALLGLWIWAGFSFKISFRFFRFCGPIKGFYHFSYYIFKLAGDNFVEKITLFFRNRAAVILVSIYLIHLIGLIHTQNFDYALKDLRVKLPLLLLPIVISTMKPLPFRRFKLLMMFFLASVLVGTLVSAGLLITGKYVDIREISPFISPIRFGLSVSFGVFILVYFAFHDRQFRFWHRVLFVVLIVWFTSFLFLLEAITSIIILVIGSIAYLIWLLLKTRFRILRAAIIGITIAIPLLFVFEVWRTVVQATTPPTIDYARLEKFTSQGNPYLHDTSGTQVEDGRYVGLYVCYSELEETWNKRSKLRFDGLTGEGYSVEATLIRYLTSKDLRKDADGVNALTEWDIKTIEQGTANIHYIKSPGLRVRILKMLKGYEVYQKTGNPSGSSTMQRIEYIRASIGIIRNNLMYGVGTGDLDDAFSRQYEEMNTPLEVQYRYHAHNQFLGIAVAFGWLGLVWFIFALVYPGLKTGAFHDYFFNAFFLMIVISMLSDDTIETQAGATLFAFFFSLLLFGRKREANIWQIGNQE
ncbi:MAG: O-antigen ligase family protein [Bacteroidales bacterium]